MSGLSYSKISTEDELEGLNCGEQSIDVMIHEAFFPHILKQQNTYCIRYDQDIIGSFAITVKAIDFENSDKEIAEFYSKEPYFGAFILKYIAVDTNLQSNGIGTIMLQVIIQKAKEAAEKLPIRCLVLDALRGKVEFYKKCGFEVFSERQYESESETVKMYFDLMSEEERRIQEEYCQRI